jgi:hypothetical protein
MATRFQAAGTSLAFAAASVLLAACSETAADADKPAGGAPPSSGSATTEEDELPAGVLALPGPDAGKDFATLDAGRYRVPLGDSLSFDVDLPQETYAHSGGAFLASGEVVLHVTPAGETFQIPVDSCLDHSTEAVGPTVADLVQAIGTRSVYRVSRPEPVELAGASGQYLELRIPAGFDATSCQEGVVGLPASIGDEANADPGHVSRWWILDVAGERVVVAPSCGPCDAGSAERMRQTVQSITFTPTP